MAMARVRDLPRTAAEISPAWKRPIELAAGSSPSENSS
jgi:hypothetical protein